MTTHECADCGARLPANYSRPRCRACHAIAAEPDGNDARDAATQTVLRRGARFTGHSPEPDPLMQPWNAVARRQEPRGPARWWR